MGGKYMLGPQRPNPDGGGRPPRQSRSYVVPQLTLRSCFTVGIWGAY
jgi:hypothetical protein